jgi:tripartite-type tricarboxylate transporter receptor subunit TctC
MVHSVRWALAALALAVAGLVQAQEFPVRSITMIVPWPAGGSTDTHMRRFSEISSRVLGQQIVVENRPGGGGTIGPGTMAQTARPDGYTLSQLPMGAFRIPHMQKVAWDPLRDFTYIIGVTGYTFEYREERFAAQVFREMLDYAKQIRAG